MTALLALAALLAAPPSALWIERDGADLRLSSDLSSLLDDALARRLQSGLTTTLHLRVAIRPHPDGDPAGDTWRGARVRWELWDEKVTAVIDGPDPDPGELFDHVYAEITPALAAQRRQLLTELAKEA